MKRVTIKVVDKRPDDIDVKTYEAAKKKGEIECNYVTAVENVRVSKGLYEIKPEPKPEADLPGLKEPEDMTKAELAQEMQLWGKPIKKGTKLSGVIETIKKLRSEAVANIEDDDEA